MEILDNLSEMYKAMTLFIGFIGTYIFPINFIFGIVIVFFERRNPSSLWAWLLLLFFIPGLGFIVYLFLGQDLRRKKIFQSKEIEDHLNALVHIQEEILESHKEVFEGDYERYRDMVNMNLRSGKALLTDNNHVDIFIWGKDKFKALKEDLEDAKHFIHMEYYIIKNDFLAKDIFEILGRKAKEGVEVRLLYDGMGCRTLPKKLLAKLKADGVKIGEFFPPFIPFINLRLNFRNHRKICIIDGDIGYVGGVNIGKEYLGQGRLGTWRDTHLRIQGDAVTQLQMRFALDWDYITKEKISLMAGYYQHYNFVQTDEQRIQIVSSGPDSKWQNVRNGYIKMINEAEKRIFIQTPYVILDDCLLETLKIAALAGIDVRIMMPCQPDHPFVYWASYSYVGELLQAGVKVYTYNDGFIHSKVLTVDGLVGSVGTANMDIRSFKLNFEVNAFIYDRSTTMDLERIFKEDMKECTELTVERYNQRSLLIRIKESVSRLFSPIL